mmetsp:Transcript_21102/g.25404  ORF Transcript_21102/g.25404 Transcript_21102/m.25404 type:complete len:225 (-) Transcript_21102:57-731(-)
MIFWWIILVTGIISFADSFSTLQLYQHNHHHNSQLDMTLSSNEIYDIPDSGWTSPSWNWGSARGTGHDCAMICRQRWSSRKSRISLIEALLDPQQYDFQPENYEEIKLILGLAWQNGRWDGSDGGPQGGYGDVLKTMAQAKRYERSGNDGDLLKGSIYFVQDMQERFGKLSPAPEQTQMMKSLSLLLIQEEDDDSNAYAQNVDIARRQCAGLVLSAMGFVERGL